MQTDNKGVEMRFAEKKFRLIILFLRSKKGYEGEDISKYMSGEIGEIGGRLLLVELLGVIKLAY